MKDGSRNFREVFKNTNKQNLNLFTNTWRTKKSGTHLTFRDPTIILVPNLFNDAPICYDI